MVRFEPVVIEPTAGSYAIRQGSEPLFIIPATLFETLEADQVFPPLWQDVDASIRHTVRYILWHPPTGELLMSLPQSRPPRLAQDHGRHPFRAYLQAYWFEESSQFLLRPFWYPENSKETFDHKARLLSLSTQLRFLDLMGRLRPPTGWHATLNAVARYQRLIGMEQPTTATQPDAELSVFRACLAPPGRRDEPRVREAIQLAAVELSGRCFPCVDADTLRWIEALGAEAFDDLRALLNRLGLDFQQEAFQTH